MRQHVSILVIAYIFLVSMGSLVLVSGKDRRSDTLFGRTRREHGKDASNQAQEEDLENPPPKYTFERRRLSGEEAAKAEATRIDPTYEPEMNLIQRIKAGTFDFFTDALPEMLESVTKDEAGLIFENFKVMKTTKAWKAFQESGDTEDEEAVASAMIKSVQEMGQIMLGARYFTKDADSVTAVTDEFVQDLKANDPSAPRLFDAVREGDPRAVATLQQMFADRYLGGVDLDAFQDNEWIEKARARFFANEDLLRLVDDNDILDILRNPDLKLHKASEMGNADPSRLLNSLMESHARNHGGVKRKGPATEGGEKEGL